MSRATQWPPQYRTSTLLNCVWWNRLIARRPNRFRGAGFHVAQADSLRRFIFQWRPRPTPRVGQSPFSPGDYFSPTPVVSPQTAFEAVAPLVSPHTALVPQFVESPHTALLPHTALVPFTSADVPHTVPSPQTALVPQIAL